MNKFTILALAAGIAAAGAAQVSAQAISQDRAQAIALAKVPNNQGVTSVKFKNRDGVDVYEFDIETPGPGHEEVRVNAATGAIVEMRHEDDLIGGTGEKIKKTGDKVGHEVEKDANKVGHAVDKEKDRIFKKDEWKNANPRISEMQARDIAQRAVPNAPVKDVDLETENGVLIWEVSLDTAGKGHTDVDIDATTGRVLRQKLKKGIL